MITSWSFSRYSDYKKCPALAKYKHVMKMKEPPNKAMERGTAIHKLAEDYVDGNIKRCPTELKLMEANFKHLKKQKTIFIEEQWAFRKDWSETDWKDWDGCWLRIKIDVAYINGNNALSVIDHKTGSMREERKAEYMEQLELYGLAGLVKFPDIEEVIPSLWYIDHGVVYPGTDDIMLSYTQDDKKQLMKLWEGRVKPMLTDKTFKPKPNYGCSYCAFSKAKGGMCKY